METGSRRPVFWQNTLLPSVAMMALAGFSVLYLVDPALYLRVLHLWSFVATDHPFLDVEYVTAQIACWARGIDVYKINPCDPLGRLHDYSPLWLRIGFLPAGAAWAKLLGVAQDVLFAGAAGFLPAVPDRRGRWLLVAGAASPTVLFAMERGNVDVLMFVLTVAGLACLERRGITRIAGYGAFLIAGLLKFYPLVLFARAADERPRFGFAVAAVAAAATAYYGVLNGAEIRQAIANVPLPSDFGDGFSSHQLGDGLGFLLHTPRLGLFVTLGLDAAAVVMAAGLSRAPDFARAFDSLSGRARSCLVAGALLFCGCFLSGPSVGYRGVVLLLALPACLQMGRTARRDGGGRMLRFAALAMVLAMWSLAPMMTLGPKAPLGRALGPLPFLAVWVCREALWWVVCTMLLAVIFRFGATSRMAVWAAGTLGKAEARAAAG